QEGDLGGPSPGMSDTNRSPSDLPTPQGDTFPPDGRAYRNRPRSRPRQGNGTCVVGPPAIDPGCIHESNHGPRCPRRSSGRAGFLSGGCEGRFANPWRNNAASRAAPTRGTERRLKEGTFFLRERPPNFVLQVTRHFSAGGGPGLGRK